MHKFIDTLRSNTNYPTYRALISVFAAIGYLAAAGIAVVGIIAIDRSPAATILGIALGALIVILTRMLREVWIMAADIADAVVDSASRDSRPAIGDYRA